MRQHQRHQHILQAVESRGFISIEQLAEQLQVTPQTLRRDLTQLEQERKLKRYHGGAGPIESSTVNTEYATRKTQHFEAKERIANLVADFLPDGASLFLNIGTTTESIARALKSKRNDMKVVTNNLNVASILSERDDFTVIVAGGEVRNSDGGIVGESAVDLISQFQMDYAVIGISGILPDGELLDYDYREVRVSRAIIENAGQILLCADNSKFSRTPMVRVCHINRVDHLFTDQEPSAKVQQMLLENDVALHH